MTKFRIKRWVGQDEIERFGIEYRGLFFWHQAGYDEIDGPMIFYSLANAQRQISNWKTNYSTEVVWSE